ncbi:MAG: DUF4271 domain-containing protein [Cyclobacteriaceae bacterium]|nr:DUF4271 domain-containing protein [Cyclobacteriaceae bacterium]
MLPWIFLMLALPHASAQEFLAEEDLHLDWIFYDADDARPLPFLANRSASPYAIHLSSELNRGKAAFLKVTIPSSTSVLIENKFMEFVPEERSRFWSLDSLKQIYKTDNITITLYRGAHFLEPVDASIGYKFSRPQSGQTINPMVLRPVDEKTDYFKILLLLVFGFFVILQAVFPAELLEFYNIKSLVSYRINDTLLNRFRSVTKIQVLIIVFEAALLSALMLIVLNYYKNPLGSTFILSWNPIFGWLVLFFLTFISLWLKYFVILFFSMLFNVFERANLYFIEYNRITLLFYSLVFVLIAYALINFPHNITGLISGLSMVVFAFYFVRMAILYFKLHNIVSINNLHLFSYLCATELVPIVIGLNFFLR